VPSRYCEGSSRHGMKSEEPSRCRQSRFQRHSPVHCSPLFEKGFEVQELRNRTFSPSRPYLYLGVLYYTTGHYAEAGIESTKVLDTPAVGHNQHVWDGVLLPKINDGVDIILGLITLYQFLSSSAVDRGEKQTPL
jgi:hypothetical protein